MDKYLAPFLCKHRYSSSLFSKWTFEDKISWTSSEITGLQQMLQCLVIDLFILVRNAIRENGVFHGHRSRRARNCRSYPRPLNTHGPWVLEWYGLSKWYRAIRPTNRVRDSLLSRNGPCPRQPISVLSLVRSSTLIISSLHFWYLIKILLRPEYSADQCVCSEHVRRYHARYPIRHRSVNLGNPEPGLSSKPLQHFDIRFRWRDRFSVDRRHRKLSLNGS